MVEATTLAWIAGVSEGEGDLGVQRYYWDNGRKIEAKRPYPYIRITNTDIAILEACKPAFQGRKIMLFKRPPRDAEKQEIKTRKLCYSLHADGRSAIRTIRLLLPYMKGEKGIRARQILGLEDAYQESLDTIMDVEG